MKKNFLMVIALVVVFAFIMTSVAFAQPAQPEKKPMTKKPMMMHKQPTMMHCPMMKMMMHKKMAMKKKKRGCSLYCVQPALTDAQKKAILELKMNLVKEKYPLKADYKVIKLELMYLAKQPTLDEAKITDLVSKKMALKAKMKEVYLKYHFAVLKVLTPAQKDHIFKDHKTLLIPFK